MLHNRGKFAPPKATRATVRASVSFRVRSRPPGQLRIAAHRFVVRTWVFATALSPPSKGFVLRRPSYCVASICLESLSLRLLVSHRPIAMARPPEGAQSFASLDAFVRAPRPSRQHRPLSVYRFLSSVASLPSSDEIVLYVTDRNQFPGISGSAIGHRLRYLRPPFYVLPQSRSSPTAKADHRSLNKHAVILNRRSSPHQLQITVRASLLSSNSKRRTGTLYFLETSNAFFLPPNFEKIEIPPFKGAQRAITQIPLFAPKAPTYRNTRSLSSATSIRDIKTPYRTAGRQFVIASPDDPTFDSPVCYALTEDFRFKACVT